MCYIAYVILVSLDMKPPFYSGSIFMIGSSLERSVRCSVMAKYYFHEDSL